MIHQFYFIWIIKKNEFYVKNYKIPFDLRNWTNMKVDANFFQCLALLLVPKWYSVLKVFFFLANINWSLWIRTFYSVFIIIFLLHFWIKCGNDWISQTRLNPPHFSVPISNIGTVLSISVCCLKCLVRWNGFGNFSDSVRCICTLLTWSQILELTLLRLILIA